MFTSLEEKRQLLEDLELLDYAITKRIKVNPKIYTPKDANLDHNILFPNKKIADASTILQKHEVKSFVQKYEAEKRSLVNLLLDEETSFHDTNILKRPAYEKGDFTEFFKMCEDVLETSQSVGSSSVGSLCCKDYEIYDLFSCNANYPELKRKIEELEDPTNLINNLSKSKKTSKKTESAEKYRILSSFSSDIKLSLIFTPEEVYGTQFDIKSLYREWLSLPRYKPFPTTDIPKYKTFLKNLTTRDGTIKVENPEYKLYLELVIKYLKGFIDRVYPLSPLKEVSNLESHSFSHENYFCLICNKQFAKDTVYNSHLSGKKHTKALQRLILILKLESEIVYLLETYLKDQFETTLHELERTDLLTVRERELEKREVKPLESGEMASLPQYFGTSFKLANRNGGNEANDRDGGYGYEDEDDEDDEKLYNPLNLPIGPDGRPIPFWLWKLKGLGHEFKCEICNNTTYKGRTAFNKHFKESTHLEGLKALGVRDNFSYFKDLSSKKEVQQLLETLQKKHREQLRFLDNTEQVEDEQGNPMNRKVYEQLQKQGLL
ncbi:hypothetical protein PMKS-002841 [Pichia membranifaciens]|uniref:C2H2-type domain-containing protein n=1 Tax=Pichia membranifaciens TaxID=4926 RepID=A0A1Q2YII3_9ASCO|nr:hypothetical protein PMKS-002841 [Pichia membranifaciens]